MTVFFDVDTQADFLYPTGALYVPGAEKIIPTVAALNRWAAAHAIPVISTMDAHTTDDPEFAQYPPHCIAGTPGQQKPTETLIDKHVTLPNTPGPLPHGDVQQFILEKQSTNCFTAPQVDALLKKLDVNRAIVYGVVTEICVRHAAHGLLKSGRNVELVTDAVRSLNDEDRDKFFAEFQAAGGTFTTSTEIIKA